MKKKIRRQRKRNQPARHGERAAHAKQRKKRKAEDDEPGLPPWLRILPHGSEDEPSTDVSKGSFSLRNGRRQPRDLDLYIPEDNSRSR